MQSHSAVLMLGVSRINGHTIYINYVAISNQGVLGYYICLSVHCCKLIPGKIFSIADVVNFEFCTAQLLSVPFVLFTSTMWIV